MRKMQLKRMLAIILAFSFCLIFVGCGKTKIDMKEYMSVSFSKCNGYGQMDYTVDTEAIDALVKEDDVTKFAKETMSFLDGLLILPFDDVTFSSFLTILPEEEYSNLSNGDIVKFKLDVTDDLKLLDCTLEDIEKELKVEFSSTEFTYEVYGLQDAEVIDLLSIVKDYIVYEGASGGAHAKINIPNGFEKEVGEYCFIQRYYRDSMDVIKNNKVVDEVFFKCEYQDFLSNGDTFQLVCYKDSSFAYLQNELMNDGYALLESIDITVNGLSEYINEKEELKEDMITKAIEYMESEYDYSWNGCVGVYWGTLKSSSTPYNYEEDKGRLFVVTTKEIWGETHYKVYGVRIIENVDGEYIFEHVGFVEDFENLNDINNDDYELEKIS